MKEHLGDILYIPNLVPPKSSHVCHLSIARFDSPRSTERLRYSVFRIFPVFHDSLTHPIFSTPSSMTCPTQSQPSTLILPAMSSAHESAPICSHQLSAPLSSKSPPNISLQRINSMARPNQRKRKQIAREKERKKQVRQGRQGRLSSVVHLFNVQVLSFILVPIFYVKPKSMRIGCLYAPNPDIAASGKRMH